MLCDVLHGVPPGWVSFVGSLVSPIYMLSLTELMSPPAFYCVIDLLSVLLYYLELNVDVLTRYRELFTEPKSLMNLTLF